MKQINRAKYFALSVLLAVSLFAVFSPVTLTHTPTASVLAQGEGDPDATPTGATDLGDITGQHKAKGNNHPIDGVNDVVDYFTFSLTATREVMVKLREMERNADLSLEDQDGNELASSTEAGTADEAIFHQLDAGAYYIRVKAMQRGSNVYKLRYRAREIIAENVAPTGEPTIDGTAEVGQTLTADTSGISDENGLTNAQFSYQWLRKDAEIPGATGSTYNLTAADEANTIRVRVSFTDDDGYDESLTSASTNAVERPANVAATGQPTITGTAQMGETLTADTSAINDENGLDNVQFTYQWIRNDGNSDAQISSATRASHSLTVDDVGNTIKVQVSFTDDDGYTERAISVATEPVSRPPNVLSTGEPAITGTLQVGEVLTADISAISDDNGLSSPGFTYQWIKTNGNTDSVIAGATAPTYRLTASDAGSSIKVQVNFTDDDGYAEMATSAVTSTVNQPPNALPTGKPAIKGTPQVGETLSVDTSSIQDINGLSSPAFTYQWVRTDGASDANIDGATSPTYQVTDADTGSALKVSASFTDDHGYGHTLISVATTPVATTGRDAGQNVRDVTSAALTGLSITDADGDAVTIDPEFASTTTSYEAVVSYDRSTVTVSPTKENDGATVQYLDDTDSTITSPVSLAVGLNTIKVRVTSQDGNHTETYTVVINRLREPVILVSNIDATRGAGISARRTQNFTTGSVPTGYSLTSVGLSVHQATGTGGTIDVLVRIFSVNADGTPNAVIHTMTNPSSYTANQVNLFTAPKGTTLDPDTTYAVMISNSVGDFNPANFVFLQAFWNDETSAAAGWSIANNSYKRSSGSWVTEANEVQIQIKGQTIGDLTIATLSDLTLTDADGDTIALDPDFDPDTTSYEAVVTNEASTITVLPDSRGPTVEYLDDADTTITDADTNTDGHQVALAVGLNTIKVRATSLDGNNTETYTVVATRLPEPFVLVANTVLQQGNGASQRLSQSFTTGPNPQGYSLTSVGLVTSRATTGTVNVSVKLFSAKSDGTPGGEIYALTNPSNYTAGQIALFTAPKGATLDPSTDYFVVTSGGDPTNFIPAVTADDSEHPGAVPGWSIADDALKIQSGVWVTEANALQISIAGQVIPDPTSATLSGLTITDADGDTITLAPEFDPDTTSYEAVVTNDAAPITVLAVAHGTIEYLDETDTTINDGDSVTNGHQMALDDGTNTIKVKITSLDGNDTKTYTFVITRLREPIALVSNTGQSSTTGPQERLSQSFTTGTNPQGYSLNSIGLVTSMDPTNVVRVIVKLFSANNDGTPGGEIYTLTNPSGYTAGQVAPFIAPKGATLDPSTTYFVVTSGGNPTNYTPAVTDSDSEDDGAAPGWSITDHALAVEGGVWVERTSAMQISINGQGMPDPSSTALLNLTITSQDEEAIALTPEFSPTTTDYAADVLNETDVVTVLPTTDNQAASVEYLDDSDLPIGDDDVNAYGHQVVLAVGLNNIKVKVTSQDGNHVQTYTVIVARRGEPVALVSNTSQSSAGGVLTQRSQNFTTGPRTKGYRLTSIELLNTARLAGTVNVAVRLFSTNPNGTPRIKLYSLTNPSTYAAQQVATFTAPKGATLDPNTTYSVVVSNEVGDGDPENFAFGVTESDNEDSGTAPGWSIADSAFEHSGSDWTASSNAVQIRVTGQGFPDPTNASLRDLVIEDIGTQAIALDPAFDPDETSYSADAATDVEVVTLLPTTEEHHASIAYLDGTDSPLNDADLVADGFQVELAEGENTIKIEVTAPDETTTKTYTVVINHTDVVELIYNRPSPGTTVINTRRVGDPNATDVHVLAQKFTTGPNQTGYTLANITFKTFNLNSQNVSAQVSLYDSDTDGNPNNRLANIGSAFTPGYFYETHTLNAPDATTLLPDTNYFFVFEDTNTAAPHADYWIHIVDDRAQTRRTQHGWSLKEMSFTQSDGQWATVDQYTAEIVIRGRPNRHYETSLNTLSLQDQDGNTIPYLPELAHQATSYYASAGTEITEVTIDAEPSNPNATLEHLDDNDALLTDADLNKDGFQFQPEVGRNIVKLKVIDPFGVAFQIYTITFTRTAAAVLISNLADSHGSVSATVGGSVPNSTWTQAQKFTTGLNAVDSEVASIEFRTTFDSTGTTAKASIYDADDAGNPGSSLVDLEESFTPTEYSTHTLTAPPGANLDPNADYFVVFQITNSDPTGRRFSLDMTPGNTASERQTGWSLGDRYTREDDEAWSTDSSYGIGFKLMGRTPTPTIPPTPEPQPRGQCASEPSGQDLPATSQTAGRLSVGDCFSRGFLSTTDTGLTGDAFTVSLQGGRRYRAEVLGRGSIDISSGGTYPAKPTISVRAADGTLSPSITRLNDFGDQTVLVADQTANNATNVGSGPENGSRTEFDVAQSGSGEYLIIVSGDGATTGTYTVRVSDITSEQDFRDPYLPHARGDFTNGFVGGRVTTDGAAITGRIDGRSDEDWFLAHMEDNACYTISVKGQNSDPAEHGGTLADPSVNIMKFYDYHAPVPDQKTDAYYDMAYINPDNFKHIGPATKVCNRVATLDNPGEYRLVCNYYSDDNGGQGKNAQLKIQTETGAASDYLIAVDGEGAATGTYSLFVEQTNCR